MLGYIIAIRNYIIALVLAWIGISFSAPKNDAPTKSETPKEVATAAPEAFCKLG